MVHSDNSVYAQLTNIVGPKSIVETAHRLGIRTEAARVLLDRARLRRRQPARHGARVRDDRERRQARRRLDHGRPPARRASASASARRARCRRTTPVDRDGALPGRGRDHDRDPREGRRAGHRHAGRSSRARSPPARRGRTTTTPTPGSSATRPISSTAVWVGYPNELKPMETEFHGEPVAGGTLPALIWKAFMTRALARASRRRRSSRRRTCPEYDARVVYRDGRWRLDNGYCPATRVIVVLRRPAARLDRDVLRERGLGARARRPIGRVGARRARVCPAEPPT